MLVMFTSNTQDLPFSQFVNFCCCSVLVVIKLSSDEEVVKGNPFDL